MMNDYRQQKLITDTLLKYDEWLAENYLMDTEDNLNVFLRKGG